MSVFVALDATASSPTVHRCPAIITPLSGGSAHFSWRGVDHTFADVWSALTECRRLGIRAEVQPFPDLPVEVTWTHPTLATP